MSEKQNRIVALIEEKTKIEFDLNQLQNAKREQAEILKNKARRLNDVETSHDVLRS